MHPDLSSMLKLKNRKIVDEHTDDHALPVVRGAILSMFLDHLVTRLPKDQISKAQLTDILEKAVKDYTPEHQEAMLMNIKEEIKKTEEELDHMESLGLLEEPTIVELKDRPNTLAYTAHYYAKRMILLTSGFVAGQVGAFAYLIYGVYTWDDMEPVTYLVGTFYACTSFIFWFRYKDEYTYDAYYDNKFNKLLKKHRINQSRIDFLKRYHELLKLQLSYIEK